MNIYDRIRQEGLVSESLVTILFGDYTQMDAPLYGSSASISKLMYHLGLFYSALIQSKIVEDNKDFHDIADISDSSLNNYLRKIWVEKDLDISKGQWVFSFLKNCSDGSIDNKYVLRSESRINPIQEVNDLYVRVLNNELLSNVLNIEDILIEFLELLPLLRQTSMNLEDHTLSFDGVNKCPIEPFFFVKNDKLLIMTSVSEGEQNKQLTFGTIEYNCPNSEHIRENMRVTVMNDERMLMICKMYGVDTNWYHMEDYLGNCTFVVRLAEVLSIVLKEDIRTYKYGSGDIYPDVEGYFDNKEILADLRSKKLNMDADGSVDGNAYALQNLLMGLIIAHGAFTTTYDFLVDCDSAGRSFNDKMDYQKLYHEMLSVIKKKQYCAKGIDASQMEKDCEVLIEKHTNQLSMIVSPRSPAFLKRSGEIRAEQHARCILEIMGVENNNLFTDKESTLSIYDYFDMIANNNLDICEIVRKVLTFVMRFYSAITGVSAADLTGCSPVESMMLFKEYCEASNDSDVLKKAIGRGICNLDDIDNYIRRFKDVEDWSSHEVYNRTKEYFVISYAHVEPDESIVKEFHDYWTDRTKKKHYRMVYDGDFIRSGDDWKDRFRTVCDNEKCIGVISFLSRSAIKRDTIASELKFANAVYKKKHVTNLSANGDICESKDRFILPINLDSDSSIHGFMMSDLVSDEICMEDKRAISACKEVIGEHTVYLRLNEKDEVIERELDSFFVNPDMEVDFSSLSDAGLAVYSLLSFLKTGVVYMFTEGDMQEPEKIYNVINDVKINTDRCIYPILVSIKEKRIKRDSVTILGYEVVNGKSMDNGRNKVMLSSEKIIAGDYYCIPNIRSCGECGEWMANPMLVNIDDLKEKKDE